MRGFSLTCVVVRAIIYKYILVSVRVTNERVKYKMLKFPLLTFCASFRCVCVIFFSNKVIGLGRRGKLKW